MATVETISGPVITQLVNRLAEVASMLRALRQLSVNAECTDECETLAITARGLSEHGHLILDSCIRRLGQPGLGGFDYSEWDDVSGAEG